eukprot:25602-Chlamydomonas_euryale.AAC.1
MQRGYDSAEESWRAPPCPVSSRAETEQREAAAWDGAGSTAAAAAMAASGKKGCPGCLHARGPWGKRGHEVKGAPDCCTCPPTRQAAGRVRQPSQGKGLGLGLQGLGFEERPREHVDVNVWTPMAAQVRKVWNGWRRVRPACNPPSDVGVRSRMRGARAC